MTLQNFFKQSALKVSALFTIPNLRAVLVRLLKLYGLFAVLNVFYKVYMLVYTNKRNQKLWKHLPGETLDTFGVRIAKNANRFHGYMRDQALAHPTAPMVRSAGPFVEIFCNTPESIQWMLKDVFDDVTKPPPNEDYLFHLMGEFIGDEGIFVLRHGHGDLLKDKKLAAENDKWFKERKVASRIFTKANFESFMYDTFVDKAKKMVRRLEKVHEKETEFVDMQELFFSFTMDSIEKFFFGNEVNTVEGGMSEYAKAFDIAHNSMIKFISSTVFMQVANRLLLPYPFGKLTWTSDEHYCINTQLHRFFSKDIKNFRRAIDLLDKHVYGYIERTRKDPNIAKRTDIIANFLNSKFGDELSDKMIRDIVLNLTIAGRDTTACALSWMFFELSQHLDVQQKLFEEIDTKLKGKIPTMQDLETDNLPYLNGVLYETLRLHPPVPTDPKIATKDLVYHDGTIIPKGTKLVYLPFAVGRNPVTYPDPLKFNPNRWIPFKQPSLFEFPVFQAGPRFCLGKDMAQFEAKLLTTILLQNFEFRLKEGEEKGIWYSMMLTMSIANGKDRKTNCLWMLPKKRSSTTS